MEQRLTLDKPVRVQAQTWRHKDKPGVSHSRCETQRWDAPWPVPAGWCSFLKSGTPSSGPGTVCGTGLQTGRPW